jgi:alkyldihydroxyacetonephosphate synthase
MKQVKYGNIEDMVVQLRVVTPTGDMLDNLGPDISGCNRCRVQDRVATGVATKHLVIGSEGRMGVVVSVVIRVYPLPVSCNQSIVFEDWDAGCGWMQEVARLPDGMRPASCRMMDSTQIGLAQALRVTGWRDLVKKSTLGVLGFQTGTFVAVTLVLEADDAETLTLQERALSKLVKKHRGLWTGGRLGQRGYALTFAIAYIRDLLMDRARVLADSFEMTVPWTHLPGLVTRVQRAVLAEHTRLGMIGRPALGARISQLYRTGCVIYMYLTFAMGDMELPAAHAAFASIEVAARKCIMDAGGSLSHHHGIGKHRASMLPLVQSKTTRQALVGVQAAIDPNKVLAAHNGAWCC